MELAHKQSKYSIILKLIFEQTLDITNLKQFHRLANFVLHSKRYVSIYLRRTKVNSLILIVHIVSIKINRGIIHNNNSVFRFNF